MARSKIKKIIIAVAIIALSTTAVGVGSQTVVNAQTELRPDLQIKIGGWGQASDFADTVQTKCESGGSSIDCIKIQWIGQYIGAIYQYGISAAVILAIVSVMIGGFLWLVSAGSPDKVGRAKEFITAAIFGLVIALFSYLILQTVTPRLVASEPITAPIVPNLTEVCCEIGRVGSGIFKSEFNPEGICTEGRKVDCTMLKDDSAGCCVFISTPTNKYYCQHLPEVSCVSQPNKTKLTFSKGIDCRDIQQCVGNNGELASCSIIGQKCAPGAECYGTGPLDQNCFSCKPLGESCVNISGIGRNPCCPTSGAECDLFNVNNSVETLYALWKLSKPAMPWTRFREIYQDWDKLDATPFCLRQ